ncbi:hypothetical protein [Vibrio sp. 10N.261.51.F12]|uniref:hypothetical protein n=1 Tax=Vibrio sp. 10N.261.51.F12 TaxID=3229679 RepID=UPI00354F672F
MKKTILSSAIFSVLLISGCGGNSDDNKEAIPGKIITVIDGYIEHAEVCADRNANGVCDSGESLGFTNEIGKFNIPHSDLTHPIITRSIAGSSIDKDRIGYVAQSYEMIAEPGAAFVTPFTTLASAKQMTVEALANELSLNHDVISGDYIAAKSDDANGEDAIAAHALARSLVHELPSSASELDGDALLQSATIIQGAIEDHVNDSGTETLEDIDFVRSESGNYESVDIINDLQSYLVGNNTTVNNPETVWNIAGFNTYWAKKEGIFPAWLTHDKLCIDEDDTVSCGEYSVNNHTISIPGDSGDEHNEFIYTSSNLSFVVPDQGDLNLWTTEDLVSANLEFTKEDFENKTWHIVFDDSNSPVSLPTYATFDFKGFDTALNKGDVIVIEDGEEDYATTWNLDNGNLTIVFDEYSSENNIELRYATTDGAIMIVADLQHDENVFLFMTQDGDLAQNITKKWKEAK